MGFIEDDQVKLVILMGASGAGKTSLLRAGLTTFLRRRRILHITTGKLCRQLRGKGCCALFKRVGNQRR